MQRAFLAVCATFWTLISAFAVHAQSIETNSYLTPEAVLERSIRHFPAILESLAQRNAAQGRELSAMGAFDIVFSARSRHFLSGFYNGQEVNLRAERNLRPLGGKVYGSFRNSQGTFPVYEDLAFTNEIGEFKIGALFSLLRNRTIDSRRFALRDTALATQQADLEVLLTQLGVQHQALSAYWRWVANGHKLEIYTGLLDLAITRQEGLEKQVETGARAAIFLTENQQNITRRRIFKRQAERDFAAAQAQLALYYRDNEGEMEEPGIDILPPIPVMDGIVAGWMISNAADVPEILRLRPDLSVITTAIKRAQGRIALAENDLKPSLDFSMEASNDFGRIAQGGVSRDGAETILGLRFSLPLERRQAKGRIASAQAEAEALDRQAKLLEDQIAIEIQTILIDLTTASDLLKLAALDVTQADIMKNAEQRRFAQGASDFFLVNVREETAADARIRYIDAELVGHLSRADYDAASIDTRALGIAP
ncbi:MAG: TolC family protein [Pseudomonadota bacterium]